MTSFSPENERFLLEHVPRLLHSFKHWTGRDLIDMSGSSAQMIRRLFLEPFIVISHGREEDPVLNYGNKAALDLWEMSWDIFTQTPSRTTAEPENREQRENLLAEVTRKGFMEGYSGIRISHTGRRFKIERVLVWNIVDVRGDYYGQAATFNRWKYL